MGSTFLQLVETFFYESGFSGVAPTTVVNQTAQKKKSVDYVAESEYLICTRWADWDFLWKQWTQATAVGTAFYTPPTDLGTFDKDSFYLNYTSDSHIKLTWTPYKQWRSLYRQGTKTNAEPDIVTMLPDRTKVYLEAPPNAIFSMTADYWRKSTKMAADANVTLIPAEFERIVIERAKMMKAKRYKDKEGYQLALIEYNELLKGLEANYLPDRQDTMSQSDNPMVIEVE